MIDIETGPCARASSNRWRNILLWIALNCTTFAAGAALASDTVVDDQWSTAVVSLEDDAKGAQTDTANGAGRMQNEAKLRKVSQDASALKAELAVPLGQLEERIAQLGDGADQSQDQTIKQQSGLLHEQLQALEALDRRVGLVALSAQQEMQTIAQAQATALGQELFSRSAPPFSWDLWKPAIEVAPGAVRDALAENKQSIGNPRVRDVATVPTLFWLLSLALVVGGAELLRRLITRRASSADPAAKPFATALLSLVTFLGTFAPAALCMGSMESLLKRWALPPDSIHFTISLVTGFGLAMFVVALTRAVLQPRNPELGFLATADINVKSLWRSGLLVGTAMGISVASDQLIARLALAPDVSLPIKALTAFLSVSAVLAGLLLRRRNAHEISEPDEEAEGIDPVTLGIGAVWAISVAILLSGAFGYIVLANWVMQWAIWASVVASSAYFVMVIVDRFVRYALEIRPWQKRERSSPPRGIRQASVVLSALLRAVVVLLACGALFMPFGAGFTSALELAGKLAAGIQIGQIRISAASVLTGILVFLGVAFVMRMLRSWLDNSYLPTTRLAPDARDSITTIVGYLGTAVAVLWALAAVGIGADKLAILASALSVGIGFGLQAITQNFVSGLILLVERPVRLGDRIKIGDVDGTVRKVSVRSTEIRLPDYSSLIVPNSELITKPVQNLSQRYARPKLELTVTAPAADDLQQVLDLVCAALTEDEAVLANPPPAVVLRSIENDNAVLRCEVYLKANVDLGQTRMRLILSIRRVFRALDTPCSVS